MLRLSRNPITSSGAIHILNTIQSNPESDMHHLDIQDILVTYDFGALYLELLEDKPDFTVHHGGYVRSDDSYALK